MKIIIPIARPATVSVTQVGSAADERQRRAAAAATERDPVERRSQSNAQRRSFTGADSSDRPSSRVCSASSAASAAIAPVCTMRPGVHHRHRVAQRPREVEVLLHHAGCVVSVRLSSRNASIMLRDDRGREALGRLVDQQQLARLDDGARDRQHLLLPAGEVAGGRVPELLHRREEPEDPLQARVVRIARSRAASTQVLAHREAGEDAHVLRARRRCRGARYRASASRVNLAAVEEDRAGRGPPQAHDGAQAGRLAGAVAPEQHRQRRRAAPRRSTPCRMWYWPMWVLTPQARAVAGRRAQPSRPAPSPDRLPARSARRSPRRARRRRRAAPWCSTMMRSARRAHHVHLVLDEQDRSCRPAP